MYVFDNGKYKQHYYHAHVYQLLAQLLFFNSRSVTTRKTLGTRLCVGKLLNRALTKIYLIPIDHNFQNFALPPKNQVSTFLGGYVLLI